MSHPDLCDETCHYCHPELVTDADRTALAVAEHARSLADVAAEHSILAAARHAVELLEMALATETDAAREVEARGGKRTARGILAQDRRNAAHAVMIFGAMVHRGGSVDEFADMAAAITGGYARETWGLRLLRIVAEEAEDARERAASRGCCGEHETGSGGHGDECEAATPQEEER